MPLRFQKWDILIIAVVLLLAVAVFLLFIPRNETGAYAEIYQDGKLIKTLSLAEDQQLTISGNHYSTIAVRDGKIAIVSSTCPGEDCVACGWIGTVGRSIVCLPNGLEIRIVGENSDVDFVVG